MKKIVLILLVAAVFLLCFCAKREPQHQAPAADSATVQESWPGESLINAFAKTGLSLLREKIFIRDFSLPTLTGETQSLSSLKGKVVFLNFWATWCGPCRAEMPSMESLYNSYKEKGLEILAVNCSEGQRDVLAFMNSNKLSFPALLDSDGKVSAMYGIQAIPTTYLIDRENKIIGRIVGSIDWDTPEIRAVLDLLLN